MHNFYPYMKMCLETYQNKILGDGARSNLMLILEQCFAPQKLESSLTSGLECVTAQPDWRHASALVCAEEIFHWTFVSALPVDNACNVSAVYSCSAARLDSSGNH